MLTKIDNRYRIVKFLGEGGMGKVYLVEDELKENRRLALKTIRASATGGDLIRHLKNEFQLLTRLRHPNLCEVYDFGSWGRGASGRETGRYYFTMEYIEGVDIFEASENLTEFELYPLIVQICQVLSYIHNRHFIHFDVKPANIWLTDDNKVKLMDLGLAREKEVGVNIRIRGTLNYIAPEIIRGDPVDHRADLYSLGVTLYQIIAHELPFRAKSSVELLRKHLTEAPSILLEKVPTITPALSELVMKLVAKHPSDRYSSSNALIRTLNQISDVRYDISDQTATTSYILSGKFVGREKEFDELKRALTEIQEENHAQFYLFGGECGVGKSRLMREFRYHSQLNGVNFIEGACYDEGSQAYQPFQQILRSLLQQTTKADLLKYGAELIKLIPEVGVELEIEPSPELPVGEEQARLIREISAFIFEIADRKPLVIYLRNLHWSDEATIDLLQALLRMISVRLERENSLHLLICGTYCSEFVINTHFARVIPEFQNFSKIYQHLILEPLLKNEIKALIESMFNFQDLPEAFLEKIIKDSGGNTFFVEEMMKAMVERGVFYSSNGQWIIQPEKWQQIKLPTSITSALKQRLLNLSSDEKSFLVLLSVIGRPVTLRAIEVLMENLDEQLKNKRVAEILQTLQRRNFLKWKNGYYCIPHGRIILILYEELNERDRIKFHTVAAKSLEIVHSESDEFFEELAFHYYKAELYQKALAYTIKAGDKNRAIYSNKRAINFYEEALLILQKGKLREPDLQQEISRKLSQLYEFAGQLDKRLILLNQWLKAAKVNKERAEILEMLAQSYEIKSDYEKALQFAQAGLEEIKANQINIETANLYHRSGSINQAKGEYNQSLRYYEKSLLIFKELEDSSGEARLSRYIGMIYRLKGDYNTAQDFYEIGLKISEECDLKKEKELNYRSLGNLYYYRHDHDQALKYYQKGLKIATEIDDILAQAAYFNNLAALCRIKGEFGKALDYYHKSLDINKEIGDLNSEGALYNNIGIVYQARNEYNTALKYYQQNLEISRRIGSLESEAASLDNIGIIYQIKKDIDKALECWRKSLEISRQVGDLRSEGELLSYIGDLYYQQKEYDQSKLYYDQAIEITQKIDDCYTGAYCHVGFAKLYRLRGKFEVAIEHIEKSLFLLDRLGNLEAKEEVFNELAQIHLWEGDYQTAQYVYEDTLKLREKASDRERREILRAVAYFYQTINHISKSQFYYQKALEGYLEANEKEGTGLCYAGLGNLALLQKKYEQAIEYFQKALSFDDELKDDEILLFQAYLGRVYLEQKKLDLAAEVINPAFSQLDESIFPAVRAQLYVLKNLISKDGKNDAQLNEVNEAIELTSKVIDPEALWMLFKDFADYFTKIEEYKLAVHYLNESKEIIKKLASSLRNSAAEKTYLSQRYRRYVFASLIRQKAETQPVETMLTKSEAHTLNLFQKELEEVRRFLSLEEPSVEQKLEFANSKLQLWLRMTRSFRSIQSHAERNPYFTELMKITRMLVKLANDYTKLLEIIRILNSSLILDELLVRLIDLAIDFAKADSGSIMLYNSRAELEIRIARDRWQQDLVGEIYPFSWQVVEHVLSKQEAICLADVTEDQEIGLEESSVDIALQSVMCLPLKRRVLKPTNFDQKPHVHEDFLGVLYLDSYQLSERDRFSEENLSLLQTLADQASIALVNASQYEKASSDGLTHLYLRPYFEESLKMEFDLAKKNKSTLSLIKMDINGSKEINRRYGRQVGDFVLQELAQILKKSVSPADVCARYGGDEFAIILPNSDANRAKIIVNKIIDAVVRHKFPVPEITLGVGIAGYPYSGNEVGQLLLQAEQAIYVAKSRSGNQCAVWQKSYVDRWKDRSHHVPDILTGDPVRDYQNVEMLLEAIEVANSTLDLNKLLIRIVDIILNITSTERCMLMLVDDFAQLKIRVARDYEGRNIKTGEKYSHSIPNQVFKTGEPISLNESEDVSFTESMVDLELRATMCVPLEVKGNRLGVIYVDTRSAVRDFSKTDLAFLNALARQIAATIENATLHQQQLELEEEKVRQLKEENLSLQQLLEGQRRIIGNCQAMEKVFSAIRKVARTDATVIIFGESGTGKESVAHTIHNLSERKDKPFVIVDCGSIPENLIESELFGHEKGAFTGAHALKKGKFELANSGTIFLDEISELPLHLQARLLRVLQESEIQRIAGREQIKLDIRVVAATNRRLEQSVEENRFRKDLYYRLNTVQIDLPPLRERGNDIILLANFYLNRFSKENNKKIKGFSKEAIGAMEQYNWPGNIRELEHKIERATIMTDKQYLTSEDLQLSAEIGEILSLKEARNALEIKYLRESLVKHRGNVTYAAKEIGISRVRFHQLLEKYGINRENFKV